MKRDLAQGFRRQGWIVGGERRNLDQYVGRRAEAPQAFFPSQHALPVAIDRAAAVVDDETLVGEIQRQPGDLLGLVRIQHELEELVVAGKQCDAMPKRRLIPDAGPW